jgi:uncharacterized protein (DUF2164 family)
MIQLKVPREAKEEIIRSIQQYFNEDRDELIGHLAAENLLDFMTKKIGPFIYNQALMDARKMVNEKMLSMEDELYALEKPIQQR